MNPLRILRFAATVGLTTVLYKSLANKRQANVFKVNAQPPHPKLDLWDVSDISIGDIGHQAAAGSKLITSTPIKSIDKNYAASTKAIQPHDRFPTVKYIGDCDFMGIFNCQIGLPRWTLEHVKKEKFPDEHKCVYCEKARTGSISSDDCDFLGPKHVREYMTYILQRTRHDLDPCSLITNPPQIYRATVQNNSLWDDFYHYVRFLTLKYKNVYVCSGPIVSTVEYPCRGSEGYYSVSELTHFFKVILTELDDGFYRFECYKFPNSPILMEHPELKDYRELRSDIELRAGVLIFQDVKPFMIKETTTHPDFCPHWKCSQCFPPLTE